MNCDHDPRFNQKRYVCDNGRAYTICAECQRVRLAAKRAKKRAGLSRSSMAQMNRNRAARKPPGSTIAPEGPNTAAQ